MRVRLDGSNGGRIETEGFWINMNKDTLTPSRMAEGFFNRLATTTENHRIKWRPWLAVPAEQAAMATPFALRYTDGDHFEHVNNTVYWHGVHEVLAHAPDLSDLSVPPYRAVVEYRKPIKLDESVTIRSVRRDDVLQIWFLCRRGRARRRLSLQALATIEDGKRHDHTLVAGAGAGLWHGDGRGGLWERGAGRRGRDAGHPG
jgi:Acyl-ACP thioesterase